MRNLAKNSWSKWGICLFSVITVLGLSVTNAVADEPGNIAVYDETAYTEFVSDTMKELDRLYLEFCGTCGVDATNAARSRQEFLTTVRDMMKQMNAKFDSLDPQMGAALSPTETLVSIHALTMLVDILAATQIEESAEHPYIN